MILSFMQGRFRVAGGCPVCAELLLAPRDSSSSFTGSSSKEMELQHCWKRQQLMESKFCAVQGRALERGDHLDRLFQLKRSLFGPL